jgi:DNA-binding transcriptional LysR family regulator
VGNSSYDLAIGAFNLPSTDFQNAPLFKESFVCVTDKNHPSVQQATDNIIRKKDIASYPHIKVRLYRDRDSIVDDILSKQQIRISDTITVGQYLIAPQLLRERDLLFLCGRHFANIIAGQFDLQVLELPWKLPEVSLQIIWHRRTNSDPLLGWLKSEIENITEQYRCRTA